MDHEPNETERLPDEPEEEQEHYEPRPRWQIIWAWVLVVIVVLGFLGYCYWIARS
jgi:hypothetical protein